MSELDKLKQQLAEIQAQIEELEKKGNWEMKCPFEYNDKYYYIDTDGMVDCNYWYGLECDIVLQEQGNLFKTEEEAELERNRRNLLTRFRAFRDECNEGWKPDWKRSDEKKFYLSSVLEKGERSIRPIAQWDGRQHAFSLFGVFKNKKDAQRAIELFGDEIIELFVEVE